MPTRREHLADDNNMPRRISSPVTFHTRMECQNGVTCQSPYMSARMMASRLHETSPPVHLPSPLRGLQSKPTKLSGVPAHFDGAGDVTAACWRRAERKEGFPED